MLNCFHIPKSERHDWATIVFLLLAFLLPCSGFAGVLTAFSSEAEVEFFGEEEVEEYLIVVQRTKSERRAASRPKCHMQSRVVVSRTRYSEISHERVISDHRYSNGLLTPIRC
ncbi:MAG: hypothetical protein O2983_11705 [Planctomycetota bacterium]|nr:hypothetical protein [Planctomycetota bacterium]MDA0918770.1 hypothetical protein [Planctomycetota bacterium]MDA1160266.1 hypothetical protein [Planctomycetota bacterium]